MSDLPVLKLKRKQMVSKKVKRKRSQFGSEPARETIHPEASASVPISGPVPQKIEFRSTSMQPLFANQYNAVFVECYCVDRIQSMCKVQLGIQNRSEH